MQTTDIRTPDGLCESYLAWPEAADPCPAVLMFMDGIGYRPALKAMAERIAAAGFYVLLPNLFYRYGRRPPMTGAQLLQPENRSRLNEMVHSLGPELVLRDAGAFLDFLGAQPEVRNGAPVGLTGYCMGGSMAVRTAAHYSARVAVAASFHGGRLVTDAPDSPHRLLAGISADLYFGHADQDASMTSVQIETLDQALRAAGKRYHAEIYRGALHGFTMTDLPVYNQAACEQHWDRLLALLGRIQ